MSGPLGRPDCKESPAHLVPLDRLVHKEFPARLVKQDLQELQEQALPALQGRRGPREPLVRLGAPDRQVRALQGQLERLAHKAQQEVRAQWESLVLPVLKALSETRDRQVPLAPVDSQVPQVLLAPLARLAPLDQRDRPALPALESRESPVLLGRLDQSEQQASQAPLVRE